MAQKIIIAEDNPSIRSVVKMTLDLGNYEVIETTNGKEAAEALKQNPDCAMVITDISMPEMDGFQLLRKIRDEMELRDLPVFVISADKEATGAIERGATRVIRKPFSPIELLDAIKRAFGSTDE